MFPFNVFYQTIRSKRREKNWLEHYNQQTNRFQNLSFDFAPFTRCWLPGGDVTKEELKREINLFADNNFGEMEIQPMTMVLRIKN